MESFIFTVTDNSNSRTIAEISGQIDLIEKIFSLFSNKEWEINRATLGKDSEFFSLCLFSLQELTEKAKDLRKEKLLKIENILLQENLLKRETKKASASTGKNHLWH
jgi:hypothetical protein